MFQRIGEKAIKKDLTNIRKLTDLLGDPHLSFNSIHVAGTNGKGSTSHMLASIFQAAGKRVGLYTSPHYMDFRERIKINGVLIGEKQVIHFVRLYKDKWQSIQPSFFEITVAMAFDHFRNEKVDIAIIETGLGGRLDSTNIITPSISVITNIGYDHMNLLGNTLPEIAGEKAGIIKKNIPVVIGEWQKETNEVFKNKAAQLNAPLYFASRQIKLELVLSNLMRQQFHVRSGNEVWFEKLETDLAGPYQQKNVSTVLETCRVWNKYYPDRITDNVIRKGLKNVKKNTGMIGRWMVIRKRPLVITDAAHNIDGIKNILPSILSQPAKGKHFVIGFVSDKDVNKILALFPSYGFYYWCSPDIPRGKPANDSMNEGLAHGLTGKAYKNVRKAYEAALLNANAEDLVFVGGSSYVVGDFLTSLRKVST